MTGVSDPFSATWIVRAPWAHRFWHSYLVTLYDLTTPTPRKPVIHKQGVTHEMMVHALDPERSGEEGEWIGRGSVWELFSRVVVLHPGNHGYQFAAESDEAAVGRIRGLIDRIRSRELNPDTDARRQWDREFQDGVTLHYNALEAALATKQ